MTELEEQIANNHRLIEEHKEHLAALRSEITKHKEAITELEGKLEQHNKAVFSKHEEHLNIDAKIKEFIGLNYKLESELQTLRHETAVKALLDEEPTFWDAIQARLIRKISDLDDGMTNLSSYIEPRDFAEEIRNIHGDIRNLTPAYQKLHTAKTAYESLQKEACSQVVLQKTVPLESKSLRIEALDRLLIDPVIAPLWNKQ